MDHRYKVGGYVKLAKLWERSKDAAVAYHSSYYAEKFRDDADKRLVGVYIDITGNKEIYKRPEMVHLLKDCKNGSINLIFSQTRAYLAANTCDFCFLLKYLFDLPMRVDIVTDDDDQRIDTILDVDNQRQSLKDLAEKYTSIRRKDYLEWRIRLEHEMTKAEKNERGRTVCFPKVVNRDGKKVSSRQSVFAEQWSGKFGPTYSESRRSLAVKTFDNYTVITVNGKKTEVHPQAQPQQQGSMGDSL